MSNDHLVRRDVAAGYFRFRGRISPERLTVYFQNIQESRDYRYEQMFIRKSGRDENTLSFVCCYGPQGWPDEEARKAKYNEFYEFITDNLKRQFGNDFVGWDISGSIKVVPLVHGNKAM